MPIVAIQVSSSSGSPGGKFPSADDDASTDLKSYAFGPFTLIPARQVLMKGASQVRIGGRAFDLLVALVERPGELIAKQDLVSRAWPNTFVDEANLKVNMAGLRRALGESHIEPQFIATVVGRGYRFVAPVKSSEIQRGATIDDKGLMAMRVASLLEAVECIRRELEQIGEASLDASTRPVAPPATSIA